MMLPRIVKIGALILVFILVAGGSAYLTLSLIIGSEDTVVVPDLVGKDAVSVLEILTGLGLNTKIRESEYSSNHPKNQVIYQDPEPGSEIKMGRAVGLIVSKGSRTIRVPDMKQRVVRQATILLQEHDLCQGKLSYTHSEKAKTNQIIAQSPFPGAIVARGQCVDLLVSMGKRPVAVIMPDVEDLSLEDAILTIEMSNLVLGDVAALFQEDRPQGVIIGQKPLSGYRVVEGTTVHLVRNRRAGHSRRADGDIVRNSHLFRYRLESGFLKRRIQVRLNAFGISNDLYNDFVKPGEEIWLIIPKQEDVEVSLFVDGELIKREIYGIR